MKKLLFTLIFIITYFGIDICKAQYNTGFEYPCADGYWQAFTDGCVPNWIRVTGSPDTYGTFVFWDVFPPEGDRVAHAYARLTNCPDFPSRGESYALNYEFIPCKEYTLEYNLKFVGNYPSSIQFVLANNLPTTFTSLEKCSPFGDVLLPIDETNMQVVNVHIYNSTTEWTTMTVSFVPENNFNQLWIRTEMLSGALNIQTNSFVDELSIVEQNIEAPAFYTADEDGNITSSFCYGEDVTVCVGKADYDWTKTLFTVYKQPAGSFYTKTGTRFDVETGCYNLSEFIRQRGNKLFEPGFSYEIKMSVYVPGCGWYDYFKTIYVDCCEENNAGFDVGITGDDPHTRDLKVNAKRDYIYYGDEQEFCISIDDDFDGNYEVINCWQASSFEYTLDLCKPYRITHTVNTLCDSAVLIQDVYINENCEECSIIDLRCTSGAGGAVSYFWTGTPDVETYEAELIFNDSDCDCGKGVPDQSPILVPLDGNFFFFGGSPCLSIRIRPICEDGLKGEWSEKLCSDECLFIDHLINEENQMDFSTMLFDNINVKSYPTPFIDYLNMELEGPSIEEAKYQIFDLKGRLMMEGEINGNRVNISTKYLNAGSYIIFVKSSDHIIYADKLSKM